MKKALSFSQFVALMLLVSACSLPFGSTQPANTPTPEPVTPPPASDSSQSAPHELVPVSLPSERSNQAADQDSSETAARRFPPGGDRFSRGDFERPFNAETMDVYFPYLDIVETRVYEDDTWLYASITLRGMDTDQSLPGQYLMEIDQDRDGRGDWLVGVTNPSSTAWTSDGVRVWHDSNDDVGGNAPYLADNNPPYSDGYELLVYDEGKGEKPDAAFAQRDQNDPDTVLIAIQKALFDGDTRLLVGMWAGNDLDPALFDLNDHFTHEQAGAADPGLEIYYPIKAIAEMDNSCRMAVGFQPTGAEPGLCSVAAAPGQPGSPPGCQLGPNSCGSGSSFNSSKCSCDPIIIY
jgi:hypothetical protein